MPRPILVTGFDRFGPRKRPNPSSEVILPFLDSERGESVETLVLPTGFDGAITELQEAANSITPSAIIMFGVIRRLNQVRLERRATNMRLSVIRDNAGRFGLGHVVKGAPQELTSTLPVTELRENLREAGVPVKISRSAGHHVCNSLFYEALYSGKIEGTLPAVPTGFIHIGSRLSEETLQRAALVIVDSCTPNEA